jgi:hypothetical protein
MYLGRSGLRNLVWADVGFQSSCDDTCVSSGPDYIRLAKFAYSIKMTFDVLSHSAGSGLLAAGCPATENPAWNIQHQAKGYRASAQLWDSDKSFPD